MMDEISRKVSTVIPTYNRADLICEAIDSALAQDYQPHEVIVVDDGSTDGTRELLRKYEGRIRYVSQQNQGQSVAKNRGILEADSEFIATLDSDDRWLSGKLTKQVELALQDPEIGLVYTDKRKFRNTEIVQASDQIHYTFRRGWVLDHLLQDNFVVSTSVLARRKSLIEAGLFDESMRVAEDYDLWLRMARICKFEFVDEVLVEYRVGNPSIGNTVTSYFQYGIDILDRFLENYYQNNYPSRAVVQRAYANRYRSLGDSLLSKNKYKDARSAYLKAIGLSPFSAKNYGSLLRAFVPNRIAGLIRN